jgi:hypothetical protein
MARAYGQRPSSLLGVADPLAALQLDQAVFGLDEAIEGLLSRERGRLDMAELDGKGRARVAAAERAMKRLLDRITGHPRQEAAIEASRVRREVEYLWDDAHERIVAWRYRDEAHGD